VTLTTANVAGKYSLLLGGVPRGGTPTQLFEYLIKQLGFGLFPGARWRCSRWGRPLIRLSTDEAGATAGRLAFGQLYLLVFARLRLRADHHLRADDRRGALRGAGPAGAGHRRLPRRGAGGRAAEPVLGLLVATGTIVVARDFFLEPASWCRSTSPAPR
jgi:hypothetical protein